MLLLLGLYIYKYIVYNIYKPNPTYNFKVLFMLDDQEIKIVRELIRDPRLSDNKIARNTGVPVMSVNRKRKKLEESGLLNYYTYLDTTENGTKKFFARQMYIIKLKEGITRDYFLKQIHGSKEFRRKNTAHVLHAFFGEKDGYPALIAIMEAESESKLVDIFNGMIVPFFKEKLGEDSIIDITTLRIDIPIRLFHNYLPQLNIEHGKIKPTWPNEWIFVEHSNYTDESE